MQNNKKPTTYEEQLNLLKSRGCIITDDKSCLEALKSINYYRLSAFFLPFKNFDNTYKNGTNFETIINIYQADKELRHILFSALEDIEIFLRCTFSYFHAHKYGSTGYVDINNFSRKHDASKFNAILSKEIQNNKNALFVKHHLEKYDGVFPIWVIIELFTFGMLSYFYADLTTQDKKILARDIYKTVPQNITSYLRCCTDLRNICAHYGRLYFRVFPAIPANIEVTENAKRKLWGTIQAVKNLYPDAKKWNTNVVCKIESVFQKYKDSINLEHIAFPKDWNTLLRDN